MSGSRLSPQLFLALVTLALQWPVETTAIPTASSSSPIATITLMKAKRLHALATDIFIEFESTFKPEDQRWISLSCNSDALHAPNDKNAMMKKTDAELLRLSLAVIQLWLSPSNTFVNVFDSINNVHEKLKDLEEGIIALMRKLKDENSQDIQPITNLSSYDNFEYNNQIETSKQKNHGLLSCFKMDLDMVVTYLNVVRHRLLGEN